MIGSGSNIRRRVVQHDFYETADQVSGVVLLNNPSNGPWEYEEYLRLLILKRYTDAHPKQVTSSSRCYFICADGAYPVLKAYVKRQQLQRNCFHLFGYFPLCDAVIGDMDSYTSSYELDGCQKPPSTPEGGYDTVNDIPTEVIDTIRRISEFTAAHFLEINGKIQDASFGEWEGMRGENTGLLLSPPWLQLRCQLTTDFKKSLMLLSRLCRYHSDGPVAILPPVLRSADGAKLLKTGGRAVGMQTNGSDNDDARECELCLEASRVEAVVLPTFVAIGAFGGRFDHEMGAVSTMFSVSDEAHVVLVDSTNTVFACQPNGWTQIVWQPQYEGKTCGLINYGRMLECETSGLQWDIVKGRGRPSVTENLVFGFDEFLSVCNAVRREVVTVDLRQLAPSTTASSGGGKKDVAMTCDCHDRSQKRSSPPVLFSIIRRQVRGDTDQMS
uniref:Thiamin pyrophosphokinase thiamin-binding domain-containing protein n=1 Tax=Trypanosoma congolense (strain IL3000) TaxID=1068625 RepID=G0UZY6_TRYCI|nr:conserved hypothetical protein [Trypanosoma congolense IL3000]